MSVWGEGGFIQLFPLFFVDSSSRTGSCDLLEREQMHQVCVGAKNQTLHLYFIHIVCVFRLYLHTCVSAGFCVFVLTRPAVGVHECMSSQVE